MNNREKVTIQLCDVLYPTGLSVKKSLSYIVDKVIMSTIDNDKETYDLIIICNYDMLVEVIRRIQLNCSSCCDFVEIVVK